MPIIAGILSALKVARKRYANLYDDIDDQSSVDAHDLASKQAEENSPRQGNTHQMILLLFLSAFLFSLQGMFLKFTTAMGIPSLEMVFIRAAFQGVFVVAGMIICRVDDPSANTNDSDIESGPVVDLAPIYDDEEKKDDEESAPATCVREEEFLLGKAYASKRYSTMSTDSSFPSAHTKQSPLRLIERPFGTTRHMCHVVIVRGIIGGLGFINFFYTFSVLPLGDATTLVSLYPIITIFLSRVVLEEEIKPLHLVAAAFSATGAIFISRPSFLFGSELIDNNQPPPPKLGYVTAMLGSFFASAVIVLIRKAGNVGAHTLQLLFSWAAFSMLVSVCAGAIAAWLSEDARWRMPIAEELPIVLSVCIAGTIAHFLLNYSMRQLPATLGSLVRSSDIFWAYLLEIIVFGERPQAGTWFGVLFVCTSLAMVLLQTNNTDQTSTADNSKDLPTK
ncbi:hypothetical protein ACHAXT_002946 [Thalassiosira profunda]